MRKITLIIIFVSIGIIALTSLYFYHEFNNVPKIDSNKIRTEKEPIIKRFVQLNDVKNSYWKGGIYGKSNFGPSSYWMKGFIELNKEDSTRFIDQYNWKDVPSSWSPSFIVEQINLSNSKWVSSKEFDRFFIPAGFVGSIYFEKKIGIIYFEIEK